ncbi:MAG: HD domain-containing protein [Clostridia bacterium]|nr:HD domain-containing protein [Clostridia bacterium]
MEEKSPYTASHFSQVGTYAEAIARYMGKDEHEVKKTKSIAILHDAGKLLMPEELLNNPHMTVGSERAQMALHSELGETVIAGDMFDLEERGGIVDHHNARTDNKYAKIIAVADCIDTMTSQRAYNNPKAIQEVFRDLAKNMHGRSFIDEKTGKEVNLPAQFDKENATAAIVMLANELGSIGYDVRKMLEVTEANWNKDQNTELFQILNEHANEITINTTAKEGAYTSLGFRLNETGHLEFEDRPAAVLNQETRQRSEYEFAIFKNSTDEQKQAAETIMDLEANFPPEKLEEFKNQAEAKVNSEDENGRQAVQAGRVISQNKEKNIIEQLQEVALSDPDYNIGGCNKFIQEFSRVVELSKNKENEQELRGA